MPDCPADIDDCPKTEEHDRRRKWYLNRGISIDTLIAMVVITASFMLWMMKQEGRMVVQEEGVKHLVDASVALNLRLVSERSEMRDDVKEIKEQLNKLIDRQHKQ